MCESCDCFLVVEGFHASFDVPEAHAARDFLCRRRPGWARPTARSSRTTWHETPVACDARPGCRRRRSPYSRLCRFTCCACSRQHFLQCDPFECRRAARGRSATAFPLFQSSGEGVCVAPWLPRCLHGLCDQGDATMLALMCLHRSPRLLRQTAPSASGDWSTIHKAVCVYIAPDLHETTLVESSGGRSGRIHRREIPRTSGTSGAQ